MVDVQQRPLEPDSGGEETSTEVSAGGPAIDPELNAPKCFEDCLPVLKKEEAYRKSEHYIGQTREYLQKHSVPPVELDQWAQNTALKDSGFDTTPEAIKQYQKIVMHASV